MNKGKIFTIIFMGLFIFLALAVEFSIFDVEGCFNDIEIEYYEAKLTINESGDLLVEESYTYNYGGVYHAKYRDVETLKYNPQNPIVQDRYDTAYFADYNGNEINGGDNITSLVSVSIGGVSYQSKKLDGYNNSSNTAYVGFTGQLDEVGNIIGCDPRSSTCESIFVYVPDGFGEDTVFTYKYSIKGAITKYNDIASLNWRLFEYNEADIKEGKVVIEFPETSKQEDLMCWARGAEKEGTIEIVDNNTIELNFKKVRSDAALEIRVLSDCDNYPLIKDQNKVNATVLESILEFEAKQSREDNLRITLSQILFYGSFVLIVGMAFIIYRVYKKYDKEFTPEFDGEYLRELPNEDLTPAEMSYLYYFGKINDEDCTATLLDLVRRKYLELDENGSSINDKNPNFRISLGSNSNRALLKAHEKHLINWFIGEIGNGSSVTIDEIEAYPKTEAKANKFMNNAKTFVKFAKQAGETHHYIENTKDKTKAFVFALIPFVYFFISLYLSSTYRLDATFATATSIIIAIVYMGYVASIKKRTKVGCEEFAKWKAFKNFLTDFSSMEDYPMPGIIIWEKYLVYATSLKIADKVMEQLEVKLPKVDENEVDDSYSGATFMRRRYGGVYYGGYYGRINRTYSNAKSVGYKTIAAAQAARSNGSGRGGGFSGGSSFGGGGGGGRSR